MALRNVWLVGLLALSGCPSSGGLSNNTVGDAAPGGCDANPASCGCTLDTQCAGATPRCDTGAHRCAPCLPTNDNCARGTRCVQVNDTYACSASCQSDSDCPMTDAGAQPTCCNSVCTDTSLDTNNCGGCGKSCLAVPNGSPVCAGGVCAVGSCLAGYADCDKVAGNGCETNTAGDAKNCGACAMACPTGANAIATCAAGACGLTCAVNFADCDKDPTNGCEADTATDNANCGACGSGCNNLPNATSACMAGVCSVIGCSAGHADCDKKAANGCEASTQSDAANCGGCGKACGPVANGSAVCNGGSCAVACNTGYADCDGVYANGCEVQTSNDPNNCGTCAHACVAANATSACVAGACALAGCSAGFADCDKDPTNGCEVAIGSDPKNCGGCGNACGTAPNATVGCVNASCKVTGCKFGWADCNMNLNDGCEADLTSTTSCGTCGTVCAPPANATAGCSAGMCGIGACSVLHGDCDHDPTNGCEKSLATDVNNCGACAYVCHVPNATPECLGGQCGVATCNIGWSDCDMNPANGCESQTGSDPMNCGGCGKACPVPTNSTATCTSSTCGSQCKFGYADCDHSLANGCETAVAMDVSNCGACGNTCPTVANGTAACASGACGIGMCNAGYANCDNNVGNGCETKVATDVNNCGACAAKCAPANATAACLNGQCGYTACNTGYADCDGNVANGCEVNLNTDAKNCGACGNLCPVATPSCGNGTCGTGVDYGPVHTFDGLSSTHYITQGCCSTNNCNATIDENAAYFCTHFYGQRLNMTCTPKPGYSLMTLTNCTDPKMHKNGGCTTLGTDIANTMCDLNSNDSACKIGNWNECTTGITNLVCHCF